MQLHLGGNIPVEQIKVRQKKEELENVIYNNNQILQQTFDPALLENEKRLAEQIDSLQGAIASREKILKIDDDIARCRRRCEKLARGERIDGMGFGVGMTGMIPIEQRNLPPVADLYKVERRKLAILLSQAGLKEKAIADNARDEAKLPALRAELAELQKLRLDPRNMQWEK